MKLNREAKKEMREKIIEMLENVPEGKKVHLRKELLEELLFEVVVLDEEKNIKVKCPAWSGKFLRKIDLSEVDFEDVSFSLTDENDIFIDSLYDLELINTSRKLDEYDQFRNRYEMLFEEFYNSPLNIDKDDSEFDYDYSYTNAKIDLMKLFDTKYYGKINLMCVNLAGVDLSSTIFPNDKKFRIDFTSCDVSNTNLNFPKHVELSFWSSNLSNLDLSNRKVNFTSFPPELPGLDDKYDYIYACNLYNTKLNVNLDLNEVIEYCYFNPIDHDFRELVNDPNFQELIKYINENLVGCYINGKILSPGDNILDDILPNQKANGYNDHELDEQEKANLIDSVAASIEEQIKHMK